jgi:hypothetical protein
MLVYVCAYSGVLNQRPRGHSWRALRVPLRRSARPASSASNTDIRRNSLRYSYAPVSCHQPAHWSENLLNSAIRTPHHNLLVTKLHRHRVLLRRRQACKLVRQLAQHRPEYRCCVIISQRRPGTGERRDSRIDVYVGGRGEGGGGTGAVCGGCGGAVHGGGIQVLTVSRVWCRWSVFVLMG